MKTAITLSLLPSRPSMPFVLGPDLAEGFQTAADLGFDAVEIFPPAVEAIDIPQIRQCCARHSLKVSTIGTGGGAVAQGLTLTDPDPGIRERAREYVRNIIERAGELGGAAIVGSMQGRAGDRERADVLGMLGDSLAELGEFARQWDQPLLYEPLNRYETDLVHRLDDATALLDSANAENTLLLADLFHMNIEEKSIAEAIVHNASRIGHVHFVDSNRQAAGWGHIDFGPVLGALQTCGFAGYLAVEAFPLPDQKTAATRAAETFRNLIAASQSGP